MSQGKDNDGGLSLTTLAIASVSSLAAAIVVHEFWQAGAFVGAAITPVIVTLVSEMLRKPVNVVKQRTTTVNPPPVAAPRDDPFGIWEDQKVPRRARRRLHVGLAVATGLVAFVIAGFFLTGAELVLGGASGSDKYRVLPGKQRKHKSSSKDSNTSTPPEGSQPAPETQEETPAPETTPPAETTPPQTEPVPPPVQTAPAPDPGATTPGEP